jgi:hypothetical protein
MHEESATTPPIRTLSATKRLLGLLGLLAVMIIFPAIAFLFDHRDKTPAGMPQPISSIALILIGAVLGLLAAAWWGLVILTRAFTFDFRRPFFARYRMKGWSCKLVAEGLFEFAFAFVCAPTIMALMSRVTVPDILHPFALMAPLLIGIIGFSWFQLMAPVERNLIGDRLRALGITPDQSRTGWLMGISNPDRNSFKKFPLVEEDMGMLWISPSHISYRGDTTAWDFTRDEVLDVERRADAGGVSAYFGAVHVILHVQNPDGSQHRIRLHPEGKWTAAAMARDLERLAARIQLWRQNISADPSGIPYQGLGDPG